MPTFKRVSLEWLKDSNDKLAKSFRESISMGSDECALCSMFFEQECTDSDDNTSKCSFDEIDESELGHFQQLTRGLPIIIVSLNYLPEEKQEPKEKVIFT